MQHPLPVAKGVGVGASFLTTADENALHRRTLWQVLVVVRREVPARIFRATMLLGMSRSVWSRPMNLIV
jgi:hypothetical protein